MKIAAITSYDGRYFSGWQIQKNAVTVQEEIEKVLSKIEDSNVTVRASGRTDAGVHARAQVCVFDIAREISPEKLRLAMNANLPYEIRIMEIFRVDTLFDPRKDALWREYMYFIWNGPQCYPHMAGYVWWNKFSWDDKKVKDACRYFLGEHDFSAFCKTSECPENSIRIIHKLSFRRKGQLGLLRVRGNAFLMNMVRTIGGTLDIIGRGKNDPEWILELLNEGKRVQAGPTAPATGLFLWRVGYPDFTS